jgi:hypothetical protein
VHESGYGTSGTSGSVPLESANCAKGDVDQSLSPFGDYENTR